MTCAPTRSPCNACARVAEQTKIELSSRRKAEIAVEEIAYGPGGVHLNLQMTMSRDEIDDRMATVVERTFPICDEVLTMAGLNRDAIDEVILVGGTTRIPYVRLRVATYFQKSPRVDVKPGRICRAGSSAAGNSDRARRRRRLAAPIDVSSATASEPPVARD